MTENIRDYGGVANEDTLSAAEANVRAIREASYAADDNMVYLPEGDWYIGHENSNGPLRFGDQNINWGAAGTGFVGDGPEKTRLIATSDPDAAPFLRMRYEDDVDHPDVEWKDITYDGNWRNLPNFDPANSEQWGITIRSQSNRWDFTNVRFRRFHANNVRWGGGSAPDVYVDRCSFEDIGLGNISNRGMAGHAIVGGWPPGTTLDVRNSYFNLIGGSCIDLGSSTQGNDDLTIENCYAEGVSIRFMKMNGGDDVDIRNVYYEAQTQELLDALSQSAIDDEFNGRHFIGAVGNTADEFTFGFTANHVEVRSLERHFIETLNDHNVKIRGGTDGPVAVHNVVMKDTREGGLGRHPYDDSTIEYQNFGNISCHDSSGEVFDGNNINGEIDTCRRNTNDGFGTVGDLSIANDEQGGDPFSPDVPSRTEVGVDTDGDSGEEDDTGESAPIFEDWTPRRVSSESDWSVATPGDNRLGDATLELAPGSGDSHALSSDVAGEHAETEIVALCRIPSDDDVLGSFARLYARGDDAGQWGWTSILSDGDGYAMRIRINDGTITNLGQISVEDTAVSSVLDNWFYRRFEVTGDVWRMRAWDYGDDEPDSWDIEATTDRVSASGFAGVGGYSTDVQQFDYISVGTGGSSAQLPDSDSSPTLSWEAPSGGETVSETSTIRIDAADVEDDGSLDVEYRIDDSSWITASYNTDTSYYEDTWDSTTVTDGEHRLEARASESSDNTSIDVVVDNEVAVKTLDPQDVTDSTATALGELTEMGGNSEVDVGFEWRASEQDTWNLAGEQTVDSTGEFQAEVSGLESDTDYELRAVVLAPEEAKGDIRYFRTNTATDENAAPTIEVFDVADRSNSVWTRFDVDWTISDEDGNLDRVVTELLYGGVTVDAETTSVSGETGSYTHSMRVRGDVDEIQLSVNDTENAVNTESKSV